jgi:hypothetical protein
MLMSLPIFETLCSSTRNSCSWYQWKEDITYYNFYVEHLSWINLDHVYNWPSKIKIVTEKHLIKNSKFLVILTTLKPQLWHLITFNSDEILIKYFHNNELCKVIFKLIDLSWKLIACIDHKLAINSCTW